MYWREVSTLEELNEYIVFEQSIFPPKDWLPFNTYRQLIEEEGLRIFLLTIERGRRKNRHPETIGSFNVFISNGIAYMGGFAIGKTQRGFRLSRKLMDKLIEEFGNYEIVCKTYPKDPVMRHILTQAGFVNKLDKFEKGAIWSYWNRFP